MTDEPTQQFPVEGSGPPGPPGGLSPTQWRILLVLISAIVVLLAVIGGVLIFGRASDTEVAAGTSTTTTMTPTTAAPTTTLPATTTAPTTTAPTTTTLPATTTPPTTTTSTTTTTPSPDPCAFVDDLQGPLANFVFLGVDGIGVFTEFGGDAEETIQTLTCLLGEPDADSGYGDSFSVFGTCPGSEVRGVRWGPLLTLYGDAQIFGSEDREFYNWRYEAFESPDTLELTFPETGIGLGATIPELQAAYGADLEIFQDDLTGGSAFVVGERDVGAITIPLIFGTLTSDQPDATVQFIDVGFFCGE